MSYQPAKKEEKRDELADLIGWVMSSREWYERWSCVVNAPYMEEVRTHKRLIQAFGQYYDETESDEIDEGFIPWARMAYKFNEKELKEVQFLVSKYASERQAGMIPDKAFAERLEMEVKAQFMSKLVSDYKSGKRADFLALAKQLALDIEKSMGSAPPEEDVELDIAALLEEDEYNCGLKWSLSVLNDSIKALKPGDFIIIAANSDQGKSSFSYSELTFFATQLKRIPGEPDPVIMVLNNEGALQRAVARLYQSALGATEDEMKDMARAGVLKQNYHSALGECQIVVKNIEGMTSDQVEQIIKQRKPRVVLFDMLDHIVFSGEEHDGGSRTDQILERKYRWAREFAVKENFVAIATSQASDDATGMKFPMQRQLKDSKVGKQGAADVIIFIGSLQDGSSYRYIGTPKNKRAKGKRNPRAEVIFDESRSRFYMPGEKL